MLVGHAREVVEGDRAALFFGECRDQASEVQVVPVGYADLTELVGELGHRNGVAVGRANDVDRLAPGDRHEPRLHVGVRGQSRIGAECGKEGLRPGVVCVSVRQH